MDLAAKRRLGQGWRRLEKVRPGGRRGGRMLRFAEADTDFGFRISALCFQHCLSPQGAGRIEPAERYTASPRTGVSVFMLAVSSKMGAGSAS